MLPFLLVLHLNIFGFSITFSPSSFHSTHTSLYNTQCKLLVLYFIYIETHPLYIYIPDHLQWEQAIHTNKREMEWNKSYLDVILVPLGFMICVGYHLWLWHKIRTQPLSTTFGINARARKLWVTAITKVPTKFPIFKNVFGKCDIFGHLQLWKYLLKSVSA